MEYFVNKEYQKIGKLLSLIKIDESDKNGLSIELCLRVLRFKAEDMIKSEYDLEVEILHYIASNTDNSLSLSNNKPVYMDEISPVEQRKHKSE